MTANKHANAVRWVTLSVKTLAVQLMKSARFKMELSNVLTKVMV